MHKMYYGTIKMKPANVKPGMYFEYVVQHNSKDPKLKVGDCVRIPKYKIFLRRAILQIGLRKSCDQGNKNYCAMDICYQ